MFYIINPLIEELMRRTKVFWIYTVFYPNKFA